MVVWLGKAGVGDNGDNVDARECQRPGSGGVEVKRVECRMLFTEGCMKKGWRRGIV